MIDSLSFRSGWLRVGSIRLPPFVQRNATFISNLYATIGPSFPPLRVILDHEFCPLANTSLCEKPPQFFASERVLFYRSHIGFSITRTSTREFPTTETAVAALLWHTICTNLAGSCLRVGRRHGMPDFG